MNESINTDKSRKGPSHEMNALLPRIHWLSPRTVHSLGTEAA